MSQKGWMAIYVMCMNMWMFVRIQKLFIHTETEAYECSCKWQGEARAWMCKCGINKALQLPYTKHTSLWISTADLFWAVKSRITTHTSQAQLHTTAVPFSILHSLHFCEAIVTQFLQCCQKLKNYISLQFHTSEKTYTRWRCYQHFTKVIMEDW